jgi:hypothetical protein
MLPPVMVFKRARAWAKLTHHRKRYKHGESLRWNIVFKAAVKVPAQLDQCFVQETKRMSGSPRPA